MNSFKQFFTENLQDEQVLVNAIVNNPDDKVSYCALGDWLEENGKVDIATIFHQLCQADDVSKFKILMNNIENNEFIDYISNIRGKVGRMPYRLKKALYKLNLSNNELISLLKSQFDDVEVETFIGTGVAFVSVKDDAGKHNFYVSQNGIINYTNRPLSKTEQKVNEILATFNKVAWR